MKHIANRSLRIPANIDLLLCEQEVQADEETAINSVLKADKRRAELMKEEKKLTELLEKEDEEKSNSEDDEADNRMMHLTAMDLNKVQEELNIIKADAAEGKARRILSGLGFTTEMMDKRTKDFSGGWRMRVSLARALFIEPTLLILGKKNYIIKSNQLYLLLLLR